MSPGSPDSQNGQTTSIFQAFIDILTIGRTDAEIEEIRQLAPSLQSAIESGMPEDIERTYFTMASVASRKSDPKSQTSSPTESKTDIPPDTSLSASGESDAAISSEVSNNDPVRKERSPSPSTLARRSGENSSVATASAMNYDESFDALSKD